MRAPMVSSFAPSDEANACYRRAPVKRLLGIVALVGLALGCGEEATTRPAASRLRLWHTFSPAETKALNRFLSAGDRTDVETTVMPFARARLIVLDTLDDGRDCPDLVRIDATWLPELVDKRLLLAAPEYIQGSDDT